MPAFRSVQQGNHCAREDFLYELKAGPAGGRLRRPSSAGSIHRRLGLHPRLMVAYFLDGSSSLSPVSSSMTPSFLNCSRSGQ
jgi:hypothetical protein